MSKTISDYKKELKSRRNAGAAGQVVAILLSLAAIVFFLSALSGWCTLFKVEDVLSEVIIVLLMVVLLSFAGWVGYKMNVSKQRYRKALARIDLLLLRMNLNEANSQNNGWIERELQLITRILES